MKKLYCILFVGLLLFLFAAGQAEAQNMRPFQPGKVTLSDGNVVEWGYSGPSRTLTLFSNKAWTGARPSKCRLVVTVYDASGKPIATEKSLTVTSDFPAFGTILFKTIKEGDASRVASFSITIEEVK